jgi:large subunit ribosomal protein L4
MKKKINKIEKPVKKPVKKIDKKSTGLASVKITGKLQKSITVSKTPVGSAYLPHGHEIPVYQINSSDRVTVKLPKVYFDAPIRPTLITQASRVFQANQRQGNASTKVRGEVTGSTRKLFRQKGTGRARHGSLRAPIFVGGGIVFGPKPRDYSLLFPKKMKRKALASILTVMAKKGLIRVVGDFQKMEPKTKNLVKILNDLGIQNQKTLIVLPPNTDNVTRSAGNLSYAETVSVNDLNTYQVAIHDYVVFAESVLKELK